MTNRSFFVIGLLIRFGLVATLMPWTQENWFIPFLSHIPQASSIDLWADFLATGGNAQAFPYGPVYILIYCPGVLLGHFIGGLSGASFGLGLTIIALDVLMLKVLQKLVDNRHENALTWLYWLSPITLYICYWHGQLDILPTLILMFSLLSLKRDRLLLSACLLAVAVAAKLSMLVAVPFVVLYLIGARRYRHIALQFSLVFVFVSAVITLPLLRLAGFQSMVLGTPEFSKSLALAIDYGGGLSLFILPMVYAALLYFVWRIRRFNFNELLCLIGLVFLSLYILTPASPGWAMWFVAFLAIHTVRSGANAKLLFAVLNLSFVALHLIVSTGVTSRFGTGVDMASLPIPLQPEILHSYSGAAFSLFVVVGAAIAMQMTRERIFADNFHLSTRRPLMIGVAGDSGSGKDTLCDLISMMYGPAAVASVSGDDYHSWDRQRPMWRAVTHLNPKANNLDSFATDAIRLGSGQSIRTRHYDHVSGRMTKPRLVQPREVALVSGLHALYPIELVERYDLKIFLNMDEGLRRHLKVNRDVTKRGALLEDVLQSIEKRSTDRERFIQPQKSKADILICLEPVASLEAIGYDGPLDSGSLRIRAVLPPGRDLLKLTRLLVSICGLHIHAQVTDSGETEVVMEGSPSAACVESVACKLAPEMSEHIALQPKWLAGQKGLMQLIIFDQLDRVRASHGGWDENS